VDAKKDDAVTEDNLEYVIQMAKNMAKKTKAVIVITGKTDLVTDGQQIYLIDNGVLDMSRITGTGCMLDGVIAGFI
ncbi:hydroxyethylthiazole kinase, partial [Bacteroides fragilis]